MRKNYAIGDIRFNDKEEYRAGLRDLESIKRMLSRIDIDSRADVSELYQTIKKQPFLFETEVGIEFRGYLSERLEGRPNPRTRLPESLFAGNVVDDIPAYRKEEILGNRREESKKKKNIWIPVGIVLCVGLILFGIYQILSYDIWSYISEQKMEKLADCVLEPFDAQVSEEHRIADLIASGKYTKQEAEKIVEEERTVFESSGNQYREINGESVLYRYSLLYEQNPELVAWIRVPDTVINYPVMQTPEDEEYYLKKGFDKKYDINGIPFMDVRSNVKHSTDNYLVYGHNMKNGSMFSALLNYEWESFYEEHPIIYFDTIYETGKYQVMAAFRTDIAFQGEERFRYYGFIDASSIDEFDEFVMNVKELAFYETGITAEYGMQLLTLSTCDRSIEEGRFVVVARKIDE